MVDADVAIPDLIENGKLLTLTTDEALKHGIADFRAESIEGTFSIRSAPGRGTALEVTLRA